MRWVIGLFWSLAFIGRTGEAAARGFQLAWSAPAQCPDAAEVRARIDQIFGADASLWENSTTSVAADIVEHEASYRLTVRVAGEPIENARRIDAPSCQELGEAAAVVIALLIRQEREALPARHPSARAPVQTSAPVPAHAHVQEGERRLRVLLLPALEAEWGALPAASAGTSLGLGLASSGWSAELIAVYFLPQSKTSDTQPEFRAQFRRVSFELPACYSAAWTSLSFGPCAVAALDYVGAHGQGPAGFQPRSPHASVWLAGLGAVGSWHASSHWELFARFEGLLAANRPRFVFDGVGPVHQPRSESLRSIFGARFIF